MSNEIYPTKHVLEKLQARDVTWGEIVDTVDNPEVVYGPDTNGRKIHQKANISVVVAKNGAVVTVLLRQAEQWTDEDARGRKDAKPDNGIRMVPGEGSIRPNTFDPDGHP